MDVRNNIYRYKLYDSVWMLEITYTGTNGTYNEM
jgi:hypothetical protein